MQLPATAGVGAWPQHRHRASSTARAHRSARPLLLLVASQCWVVFPVGVALCHQVDVLLQCQIRRKSVDCTTSEGWRGAALHGQGTVRWAPTLGTRLHRLFPAHALELGPGIPLGPRLKLQGRHEGRENGRREYGCVCCPSRCDASPSLGPPKPSPEISQSTMANNGVAVFAVASRESKMTAPAVH